MLMRVCPEMTKAGGNAYPAVGGNHVTEQIVGREEEGRGSSLVRTGAPFSASQQPGCKPALLLSRLTSNGAMQPRTQAKPQARIILPRFQMFLSGVCRHSDKMPRTPLSEVSLTPKSPLSCSELQGSMLYALHSLPVTH